MRGLINEMYLDDLKKKTMRGLEGQKLRGFSAGENVYGYRTKPVGELRLNKRGQAKYEGKIHYIFEEEAEIVRRIFREFIGGMSIHRIVAGLNTDKIPTRKNGDWNNSTVSRILHQQKYVGVWDWRLSRNVRDPMTGKKKQFVRPVCERLSITRKDLVIVDQDLWDKAQRRLQDLQGTWPVSHKKKAFYQQKSYVHTSPNHLLSGMLKCSKCDGAIVLMGGKGSGYYGCYNNKRRTCDNRLLISRKRVEAIILGELKARILIPENLEYVYKRVEKEAAKALDDAPGQIKQKRAKRDKVEGEIRHYLQFIKMGNISKAVGEALAEAEKASDGLQQEIACLEHQTASVFKPPPREWIDERLNRFQEVLEKDTVASALALREVLGFIKLEPMMTPDYKLSPEDSTGLLRPPESRPRNDEQFKPHYVAHTKIQTLALLDESYKGSNFD